MSVQTNVTVTFSVAENISGKTLHKVEEALATFESMTVERTLATAMVYLIHKFCNVRYYYDTATVRPNYIKEYTEVLPYKEFVEYCPTTYDKDNMLAWSIIFDTFNNILGYTKLPHFITKKFIDNEKSKPKRRS